LHSAVAERRTRIVIGITATMMLVEMITGMAFHSMALLADGWHMSTHVTAFLIAALAYHFSRRHATDPRYSFGTGKMGVLGGFASAVVLSVVAFLMAGESARRLFVPLAIHFDEAIGIGCVGLDGPSHLAGRCRRVRCDSCPCGSRAETCGGLPAVAQGARGACSRYH
jgi:cation diffusion facilitator family transporter